MRTFHQRGTTIGDAVTKRILSVFCSSPHLRPIPSSMADRRETTTDRRAAITTNAVRRQRNDVYRLIWLAVLGGLLLATVQIGSRYGARLTTHEDSVLRSRVPSSVVAAIQGGSPNLPYFADKRNVFNTLFVKKAWGWTSAVAAAHLIASFLASPAISDSRPRSSSPVFGLLKPVLRWSIATLYWLAVTTWFFGPSVIDRVLVYSGAECVSRHGGLLGPGIVLGEGHRGVNQTQTHHPRVCVDRALAKAQGVVHGPYWRGGHDMSGHIFLLVHALFFLANLFYPTFRRMFIPRRSSGARQQQQQGDEGEEKPLTPLERWTGYAGIALILLWWWMILMTSLFFHRPEEKLSGLIVGIYGYVIGEMLLP
jgi:hypothetical protein